MHNAVYSLIITAAGLFIFNGEKLFTYHLYFLDDEGNPMEDPGNNTGHYKCTNIISQPSHSYIRNVYPWIDMTLYNFLPFFFMITFNISIIVKIARSKMKTKTAVYPTSGVTSNFQGQSTVATTDEDQGQRKGRSTAMDEGQGQKKGRSSRVSSMTVVLLTITFVFLFCTIPICIYLLPMVSGTATTAYAASQVDLWWAIVSTLATINHSINFVLYCLTSPRFRREFVAMVKLK